MRFSAGVTVAVAALLVLSGCAGTHAGAPDATSSPSPTPTLTVAPTPSPKPTASPTPTPPPLNSNPRDLAVLACQMWQTSLSQASSEYLATQDKAKQHATDAAAGDSRWQPIADDMTVLVALGNDSSPDAVAKGQATFTDLSNQCRAVGVVVSGG